LAVVHHIDPLAIAPNPLTIIPNPPHLSLVLYPIKITNKDKALIYNYPQKPYPNYL